MPFLGNSIVEILEIHANKTPNKVFCVDLSSDQTITYKEFNHYVNRFSNFIEENFGKVSIASSALGNSLAGLVVFFWSSKN